MCFALFLFTGFILTHWQFQFSYLLNKKKKRYLIISKKLGESFLLCMYLFMHYKWHVLVIDIQYYRPIHNNQMNINLTEKLPITYLILPMMLAYLWHMSYNLRVYFKMNLKCILCAVRQSCKTLAIMGACTVFDFSNFAALFFVKSISRNFLLFVYIKNISTNSWN